MSGQPDEQGGGGGRGPANQRCDRCAAEAVGLGSSGLCICGPNVPCDWCSQGRALATPSAPSGDHGGLRGAGRASWQDETVHDLLGSARRIIAQTDGCDCPDVPHQNGMHDLAHDAARILSGAHLARLEQALRYISSPTMGLPSGRDAEDFVGEATESNARLALATCIRTARAALAAHPVPEPAQVGEVGAVLAVLAEHTRLTGLDFPYVCSCDPATCDASQSYAAHLAAVLVAAGVIRA